MQAMVGSAVAKFVKVALGHAQKRFKDGRHMLAAFEQVCPAGPARTIPNT